MSDNTRQLQPLIDAIDYDPRDRFRLSWRAKPHKPLTATALQREPHLRTSSGVDPNPQRWASSTNPVPRFVHNNWSASFPAGLGRTRKD